MNLEDKQADWGKIYELMRIANGSAIASTSSDVKKLFNENDIYHRAPQEVTILGNTHKHKYSFFRRVKAKIELYEIYSENKDNIIKDSIMSEIGNPNIFYVICNSLMK